MERANCRGKAPNLTEDPDAKDPWFPRKGEDSAPGKIMCFTCVVRAECKDYKLRTNSKHGMWAGEIEKRSK